MEYTHEQLLAIASNKDVMKVLTDIAKLIARIETVEWRVKHNETQRAKGDIVYYGENQEILDSMKRQLVEGQWACTCSE